MVGKMSTRYLATPLKSIVQSGTLVIQAGFKFASLLFTLLSSWDYRLALPVPVCGVNSEPYPVMALCWMQSESERTKKN